MQQECSVLEKNYKELTGIHTDIITAVQIIVESYKQGGKILLCGNGGSAADCEHIVGELLKEFKKKHGIKNESLKKLREKGIEREFCANICEAIPAISLTGHFSFQTAFQNDVNGEYSFAQQIYVLGKEKDVLWAISTSGNSKNVLNAAAIAQVKGLKVIGLTGKNGGILKQYCDVCIQVPSDDITRVQELHVPVYHTICEMAENEIFA